MGLREDLCQHGLNQEKEKEMTVRRQVHEYKSERPLRTLTILANFSSFQKIMLQSNPFSEK